MSRRPDLRGLYAITSTTLCMDEQNLLAAVAAALRGGAQLIQYRDKSDQTERRRRQAGALRQLCDAYAAKLLINDDCALALDVGADGVHLGQRDVGLADARRQLGPHAILGASCGPSLERAQAAAKAGADYVAVGRFFDSRTKPDAPQATLESLRAVRRLLPDLPICVIGGLTPDNAGPLTAAGADLLAAVEGVFGAPEPAAVEAAARRYAALFSAPLAAPR